jgi:hypothetical protein
MSDYWYDNRSKLQTGMVFSLDDGDIVRLDRKVPGDGTLWYADNYYGNTWLSYDYEVEPGDLDKRRPDLE